MSDTRILVDVCPTGFSYADRGVKSGSDFKRIAFLSFSTLALSIEQDCPKHLRAEIEANAALMQARRGELYQVPNDGKIVILGSSL